MIKNGFEPEDFEAIEKFVENIPDKDLISKSTKKEKVTAVSDKKRKTIKTVLYELLFQRPPEHIKNLFYINLKTIKMVNKKYYPDLIKIIKRNKNNPVTYLISNDYNLESLNCRTMPCSPHL